MVADQAKTEPRLLLSVSHQPRPRSGGGGNRDIKGYSDRVAVVLARIALQREQNRVDALALSAFPRGGAAAVDVQGRHAIVPVLRFVVPVELGPEGGAHLDHDAITCAAQQGYSRSPWRPEPLQDRQGQ